MFGSFFNSTRTLQNPTEWPISLNFSSTGPRNSPTFDENPYAYIQAIVLGGLIAACCAFIICVCALKKCRLHTARHVAMAPEAIDMAQADYRPMR